MALRNCPVCDKTAQEHTLEELDKCHEKFLKSLQSGDQT